MAIDCRFIPPRVGHELREIQHYALTRKVERRVYTVQEARYKQCMMQATLGVDIENREFSILQPAKKLRPRSLPKHKYAPPIFERTLDLPAISEDPCHQPITVVNEHRLALALNGNSVCLADPDNVNDTLEEIELSQYPSITSVHATQSSLLAGTSTGRILVYNLDTLQRTHAFRTHTPLGPMAHFDSNSEVLSLQDGSVFLFDTRESSSIPLYSASFPSGFHSLDCHSDYVTFCNQDVFCLIDVRKPSIPLKREESPFDRVAFGGSGKVFIGSQDTLSTLTPSSLDLQRYEYPGNLCSLCPFSRDSLATTRFHKNTLQTELIFFSDERILIDRVLESQRSSNPDVVHTAHIGTKLLLGSTTSETLKIWKLSTVQKPEKKRPRRSFSSLLTIR